MISTAPSPATLTRKHIEAAIATLQPVHQVMIRLLFLQYMEPTQDDITFMARERAEPNERAGGYGSTRFGNAPVPRRQMTVVPKEWIDAIELKVRQYRAQVCGQRLRFDLQVGFMTDYSDGLRSELEAMETLLRTECGNAPETLEDLRAQAKLAPVSYALRKLAARAEKQEIDEADYLRERLSLECQAHIRRLDRFKKIFERTVLERHAFEMTSLSDEHLATIWGIAKGPLMARRVKAIERFVGAMAATMKGGLNEAAVAAAVNAGLGKRLAGGSKNDGISSKPLGIPGDPWSRALQALADEPVAPFTPKPCDHDGGGKTLVAKMRNFTGYRLGEEEEIKLWDRTVQCLHCLTLLRTVQQESGTIGLAADEVLARVKTRTAMPRKEAAEPVAPQSPAPPEEKTQDLEEILRPFIGTDAGQKGASTW